MALKQDGTLWAWGHNWKGQLGDGTTVNKNIPVQIGTDTWQAVAAGYSHTVALKQDGTLWAWGDNEHGQLGDGTTVNKNIPVQIGEESAWQAVATWGSHTVALKQDGTLWAWGHNWKGQLGDGIIVNKTSPVQIGTDTWQAVAAGSDHTVVLKDDGTLWAWGDNEAGQLGDETTVNKNIPVQIGEESAWQAVAAGVDHTVALKDDGTLWAWGDNEAGQLGDGTQENKTSPVQISLPATPTGWIVTPSAGEHGSISPSTPQTVANGGTTKFTVKPDQGYVIDTVTGCNGTLNVSTYTTGPVTADCTVEAAFREAVDSDGDGIDDAWEEKYFGNLTTATSNSDYDEDGYSDLQEYLNSLAGKDPAGAEYDPTVKNAPGGTGYSGGKALQAVYELLL